jgi:hypothetical protein
MGMEEESRLYPYFHAIWRRIDAATGYPDDFVKERITGYVTVQVGVDERGVFTGRLHELHSDQPMLETYALGVLFHALSEPLPRNLWRERAGEMIVVARFDFRTFTHGQVPPPREKIALKNVFEFPRHGYAEPLLKEKIEKWVTTYFPPIVPVPGGAYIDFVRLYQMVQNWRARHRLGAEELRAQRIQLKQEQWKSFIRKNRVDGS